MIKDLLQSPSQRRRADEFAELLDAGRPATGHELESVVSLARTLRTPAATPPMPSSDFSAALRSRLVQEAAARPAASLQVPLQRAPQVAEPRPRRIRQAVAAATAVAVLGGAGAATASTRALPGDALYGLKRGIESVQLSLATSDVSTGREQLEQADARLGEAERLAGTSGSVDTGTRAQIEQALEDMDASVRAGAATLTEVYAETGDVTALEILDGFAVEQQRRLATLMERLADIDPGLRDSVASTALLLRSLHAEVDALTRTTSAVTSSSRLSGAARDPNASGDGWAVSRISNNLDSSGGIPASSADGAEQAPPAPVGSATDVLGDAPRETGGVQVPATTPTSDLPDVTGPSGTTVDPPDVPALPTPPPTLPAPTVTPGDVQAPQPCFPVAPLTSC